MEDMESKPDKAELRAWMDRWRRVNEADIEAARAASVDERLRDLDILFRSRHLFPCPEDDEAEINKVRRRWVLLKELARAR
jgi:hypothetical protein